jgi:hypothetical protein
MDLIAPQAPLAHAHAIFPALESAAPATQLPAPIAAIMMANEAEMMQHLEGRDWDAYVEATRPRYAVQQAAQLKRFARTHGLALAPLEAGLNATLPHFAAMVHAPHAPRGSRISGRGPSCARAVARGTLPDLADLARGYHALTSRRTTAAPVSIDTLPRWRQPLALLVRALGPTQPVLQALDREKVALAHAASRALALLDPELAHAFADADARSLACVEMGLTLQVIAAEMQRENWNRNASMVLAAGANVLAAVVIGLQPDQRRLLGYVAAAAAVGAAAVVMQLVFLRPAQRAREQDRLNMIAVVGLGALFLAPHSGRTPDFFARQADRWSIPAREHRAFKSAPQLIDLMPELGDHLRALFGEPELASDIYADDIVEAQAYFSALVAQGRQAEAAAGSHAAAADLADSAHSGDVTANAAH